jgi:hypothetical protein
MMRIIIMTDLRLCFYFTFKVASIFASVTVLWPEINSTKPPSFSARLEYNGIRFIIGEEWPKILVRETC